MDRGRGMKDNLLDLRRRVRPLLDLAAARDALAAYYALYHDPARTHLVVEEGPTGRVEGFLAICQTGWDLFRPLAVLRARQSQAAAVLLRRELHPGRPYYVVTTPDLRWALEQSLEIEQLHANRVYRLDLARYTPTINVLVVPARSTDDTPRFVIYSQEKVAAEAGISWRSPHFAELYVQTVPEARGRGWGRAVVSACATWVVRNGAQPLYIVSEDNEASIGLAESVGFVDTRARELAATGVLSEWEPE